jgi:cytochrome c oxidase cbb3-type subunit 3
MGVAAASLALAGCEVEKRSVGPSPPSSPPTGLSDQRQGFFQANRYEQSEGGRMFRWFGCDACHGETAPAPLRLANGRWRYGGSVAELYRSIADGRPGMPAYAGRITSRQIWQLAGYVYSRPRLRPSARQRQSAAQMGEPSAATWPGALR